MKEYQFCGGHTVCQEFLTYHCYKMGFVCIFINEEMGAPGVSVVTSRVTFS